MRPIARFRSLLPYFRRYRAAYARGAVWILLTTAFAQLVPKLLGAGIDALQAPDRARALVPLCAAVVGASLVQGVFRYLMRRDLIGASRWIENDLRNDVYAHLTRLAPTYYDRSRTGDLMTRTSSDLEAVRAVVGPSFMYFSNTVLTIGSSLVLMLLIDPKLTSWALFPLPFLAILTRVIGRMIHARTLEAQAQESALQGRVQENLAGMRVVQSYAQEDHEMRVFEAQLQELVRRNLRLTRVWGFFFPSMALVVGGGAILFLWIGGQQVIRGAITLGDFVAFHGYLVRLTWPMIAIGWVINQVERGGASLQRIQEVLRAPAEIADPEPRAVQPAPMHGAISLRDVCFSYRDGPLVLRGLNLEIAPGETVAIVGATGSGKSTLLALVARLYDVQSGTVCVDGHDVRAVPLAWLRDGIGVVPQETFLFSDTITANLAFGVASRPGHEPQAELPALEAAAEVAQLLDSVRGFPAGFDTVLGERGITLSGGQKQRAAIARAVLRDPRILLLDDCLSSVDPYTEEEILRRLRTVLRARTALIVAHRISTVRSADRIIVLEAGRIAESGTHQELLSHGGTYARLARKQMLREALERDVR